MIIWLIGGISYAVALAFILALMLGRRRWNNAQQRAGR